MVYKSKIGKIVSVSANSILYIVSGKCEFCKYKINTIIKTIKL